MCKTFGTKVQHPLCNSELFISKFSDYMSNSAWNLPRTSYWLIQIWWTWSIYVYFRCSPRKAKEFWTFWILRVFPSRMLMFPCLCHLLLWFGTNFFGKNNIPHSNYLLVWRLIRGKVFANDILATIGFNLPFICSLCPKDIEPMQYLFFHCEFSKSI